VLGFATVDLSTQDDTLTVWLTSVEDAPDRPRADHTNAVVFNLADGTAHRRALGMVLDRYVVLTERTPRTHPIFIGWDLEPCDLTMLAEQTTAAQVTIMATFEEYRAKPGKANLMEPNLLPVPAPVDQPAWEASPSERLLTLAVANQVMRTWAAWLATEGERVKRWKYMPGGYEGEKRALLPAEFMKLNSIQEIRPLPV
jgi:hypothetical protein